MSWTNFASSAFAAAIVVATTGAIAQTAVSPMPADIAVKLKEIGRVVDPPKTALLYAPLQAKEPYDGVSVERDVKYGPDAPHTLDIFKPAQPSAAPRPVLMFVHGGAYIGGNKHNPGSPFYDNIMLWAVKNGFVGVNINYRLAPKAMWPSAAEDVASAVAWTAAHVAERGGDAAKIFLMGQSAGATHVASYVSHPELYKAPGGGIAGAIIVSAYYDLNAHPASDVEQAYFGTDASRYAEQSSFKGLLATKIPFMIAAAELDPPTFVLQFNLMKDAICKRPEGCVRAVMLPEHSHMSEVYAINTADDRLTSEILAFIKTGK